MSYPPGVQAEAIRMCRKLGVRETSRQLEIDIGTLSRWMTTHPNATQEAEMALAVADTVGDARKAQLLEEAALITEKAVRAASHFLDSAVSAVDAKTALTWTQAAEKLINTVAAVTTSHTPTPHSWRDELRTPDLPDLDGDDISDLEDLYENS
jgi:hypothetical protein